jgi:hypothetical protein
MIGHAENISKKTTKSKTTKPATAQSVQKPTSRRATGSGIKNESISLKNILGKILKNK